MLSAYHQEKISVLLSTLWLYLAMSTALPLTSCLHILRSAPVCLLLSWVEAMWLMESGWGWWKGKSRQRKARDTEKGVRVRWRSELGLRWWQLEINERVVSVDMSAPPPYLFLTFPTKHTQIYKGNLNAHLGHCLVWSQESGVKTWERDGGTCCL